jgi:transposase-like protein
MIKICPKCGSTNIGMRTRKEKSGDKCLDCNYEMTGKGKLTFPFIDDNEVDEYKKDIKEKNS